jgi:hypothetical protein
MHDQPDRPCRVLLRLQRHRRRQRNCSQPKACNSFHGSSSLKAFNAKDAEAAVQRGDDPSNEKREAREAPTFGRLVEDYLARYAFRVALANCEDKNYRTIVAAALGNGHLVIAQTPIDVNLAKQLNILISDMRLPLDRVLMDPNTGALGYGLEYTYSVMERLRLAALMGDAMTQQPMICTVGEESWRQKEGRAATNVPEAWGGLAEREMHVECILAALGVHFGPPQRVLRARVRKNGCWFMSPMAEKSGRPPDQGCPEWGPRGAAPAGGLWGELCWHQCMSGPICLIHTAYRQIYTIHTIYIKRKILNGKTTYFKN